VTTAAPTVADHHGAVDDLVGPGEAGTGPNRSAEALAHRVSRVVGHTRVIDGCFLVFCAVVALIRYALLAHASMLPGIDGGNWLALGHALLGTGAGGPGTTYPPVVPFLTVVGVDLFGPVHAVAGLAALASVAPAIGAYVVLRSQHLGWVAAMLSGFLVIGRPTGEATAWGGYPQLLGIGLSLVALMALDRYLRTGRGAHALAAGVLLALDLATSHFTGLLTVAAGTVIVLFHIAQSDRARRHHPWWRTAWLVIAPSVVLIPVYWRLLPALAQEIPGPSAPVSDNGSIGASGWVGVIGVAAVLVTPLLLWRRWRQPLWRLTTSIVVVTALAYAFTREPRLLYFGPVAAVFVAALWIQDLRGRAADWVRGSAVVASLILVVALGVQTVGSFGLFRSQRDYYQVAPSGTIAAADWLRASTPPHAVVAVTSVGGAPLGWWVEGLSQRPTDAGSSLVWLTYPQEQTRARAANSIFTSTFPSDAAFATARRLGVDYLLVATTWEGFDAQSFRAFESEHRGAVRFDDGSVVIFATGLHS
jgi:hypothetical protein